MKLTTSTQMPAREEVSRVLSMCQQIQGSRELERGRGEKKKRGRVGDVFRGATGDWNLVPHEPGGIK